MIISNKNKQFSCLFYFLSSFFNCSKYCNIIVVIKLFKLLFCSKANLSSSFFKSSLNLKVVVTILIVCYSITLINSSFYERKIISDKKTESILNTNSLTMMYETDKTNLSVLIYLNFCYNITGGYYV